MASHLQPPVGETDHRQGTANASIELVEYGDYQCSHCGDAHPVIKRIQEVFAGQVLFVFRNFPLQEAHPDAVAAALAAEAAALQNKFWQMHDAIFENQQLLVTETGLDEMAASVGLDPERFNKDRQRQSLQDKIAADFESGVRSGVNGTPSFFVNGTKFNGGAVDLYQLLRENAV